VEVELQVETPFGDNLNNEQLRHAARLTFEQGRTQPATAHTVAILITDEATSQALNQQYRGVDAPTDVLSFANTPDPDFPDSSDTMGGHLGDLVISFPVAARQAQQAGHTAAAEVTLLVVHGMLHLLGYDHHTDAQKAEMWALQGKVMSRLNLAHVQPTET
jgi:probable rRNA maturation factor